MKKKEFKSESKRLLDLMINSIYTNKDIFLRELISNASDAIDKLYYKSLTDDSVKINKESLEININYDKELRTITISDNGCGMTESELENNLGTIAKSGSLAFKQMDDVKDKDIDIIGQFGVGFYSAFMVADEITVISKSMEDEKANKWNSKGLDGYTLENCEKSSIGTDIIIHVKEDTEDDNYSDYLTEYKLKELIKKYSDYIRYPIKMEVSHSHKKEDSDEYETIKEIETINSMVPIWKKNKGDVSDEEYEHYYTDTYYDYEKPLKVISTSVEGVVSYKGLLFVPSHAPFDFYTKEYEKGLSLYSNGVLIMEKCAELLPDYFSFIKGVVDTEDVSLNISREMLQKTKSVNLIAKNIENKIIKEFMTMLESDRENYIKMFKVFGNNIKFGIYNNYGVDKEKLQDLIMFTSSKTKELITLKEYVDNMSEEQNDIYYASGESFEKIDTLPQVEQVKDKDYEILYLTDYVDEFTLNALVEYEGKKFKNVSAADLDLDENKDEINKINEENKNMFTFMKDIIGISEVRFTKKLKTHPVCLTSKGNISVEMEKVINAMPGDETINAEVVLEINENHPIANKIKDLYENDKEMLEKYSKVLYSEARLIEGLNIDNPTEISNLICEMISK
ncbi:MAG: molecular chaperone HtpG [Bacilli bacterium]|nr:molecular chaperone HtpG [Bacilli bacterium]